MGLIDRILRVVRANVNSWVGNAEETVMEMQEELVQLHQSLAQAIASQKRSEQQASQAQTTSEQWYRCAELALQQGNETLAREALTKRKSYQDTAEAMQAQIEQQSTVVGKLKKDMQSLESKIAEAKTKKDIYIARAKTAKASVSIPETLDGVNPRSSLNAFERVENQVLQLEARTKAIAVTDVDDLQKQFTSLGFGDEIDVELALMKADLSTATDNPAQIEPISPALGQRSKPEELNTPIIPTTPAYSAPTEPTPNSIFSSIVDVRVNEPTAVSRLDSSASPIQPDEDLESSEALLPSLADEQPQSDRQAKYINRLLSPLGIGSMLLLLLASATLGYVVMNPINNAPNPTSAPAAPPNNQGQELKPSADGYYHIVTDNKNGQTLAEVRKVVADAYLPPRQTLIYLAAVKSAEEAKQRLQDLQAKGIKARIFQQ